MSRARQAHCWRVWIAAAAITMLGQPAMADEMDRQLEQVRADWAKRLERIQRVRYRVSGEVLISRANITDESGKPFKTEGEPTIKAPFRWTLLLDFQTQRHRLEEEEHTFYVNGNKLNRNARIFTFDGRRTFGAKVREPEEARSATDVDLGIRTGDFRSDRVDPSKFPAFYGHGIVPYAGGGRLYPGHLTIEPDTEPLTIHGGIVHEGRQCLVLRTPPSQGVATTYDEIWVDPSRESAVVRHAFYADKTPRVDMLVWYRQTSHGWLPDRWEQTMRTSKAVEEIKRAHVDELGINLAVSDADFRIEEKPGMLVRTAVNPPWEDQTEPPPKPTDVRNFRIDQQGNRREVVFENGQEKQLERGRWPLWAGAVVLLAAALASLVWMRRRRAKKIVSEV